MDGRTESLEGLTQLIGKSGGLAGLLAALCATSEIAMVAELQHAAEAQPTLDALEESFLQQCRDLSAQYAAHLQLGQDEVGRRGGRAEPDYCFRDCGALVVTATARSL